ncbi:MAG: septum formation protein Maf [Alloprevotella sp.]|nr:septum formation protein Maf [Alloprevotella sp.]
MLENLDKYKLVLASASPRRKELLSRLGLTFKVRTLMGIDESYPPELPTAEIAEHISRKKAEGYRPSMEADDLIICADTIVSIGRRVLGKPHSVEEAKEMLALLSGRQHDVYTGVTLMSREKSVSFTAATRVTFAELTEEEIAYYVDNFLPMDKAGAYGIQDWIGSVAVESIEGSYFNVVGLPLQRLYNALKKF